MNRRLVALAVVGLAGLVGSSALAAAPSAYQRPGRNELVTVSSKGVQAKYQLNTAAERNSDLSADGRYVAFSTPADNLVSGDTNLVADVFVRDRLTGRTTRVSTSSSGEQAVSPPSTILSRGSGDPTISRNGRYVMFTSDALNLVAGDTNAHRDVFLKDNKTGQLTRVSVDNNGKQFLADSTGGDVSDDGHYVSFSTVGSLTGGILGGNFNVYVRDVRAQRTLLASGGLNGAAGNGSSGGGSLSADGRYVAFTSDSTNLVSGDTNGANDVFWHDMKTGRTVRVSVASDGTQAGFGAFPTCGGTASTGIPVPGLDRGTLPSLCTSQIQTYGANHISADGRYVTFMSSATNLVPNDANFFPATTGSSDGVDTFVRDVFGQRTERVSVTSVGHERLGKSPTDQAINDTGRYVTFTDYVQFRCSLSIDLPVAPPPGCPLSAGTNDFDAQLYDRWSGALEPVAPAAAAGPTPGQCDGSLGTRAYTYASSVSPTGRFISFISSRPDLVSGDSNGACDIFVRDRGPEAGTGGLGYGSPVAPGPSQSCLAAGVICLPSASLSSDANLVGARVVPRPALKDLFVRMDVAKLPAVAGLPTGGLLYGLRFTVGGVQYEVRAQRVPGADFDRLGGASFGLFRQTTGGLWTELSYLKGGYGTIGDAVVTAVPMSLLGGKAQLTDVTAFTAVGSYLSGPTKVLDSLRLSR